MSNLWSKIKLYAGLAIGGIIGILYFLLDHRTKQRDDERDKRIDAEQARKQEADRRSKEWEMVEAEAMTEDQNELARSQREKDDNGLPAGPVGDHNRLRK